MYQQKKFTDYPSLVSNSKVDFEINYAIYFFLNRFNYWKTLICIAIMIKG